VGSKCHFAHGKDQLRDKNDPLPLEVQYKMMNIPYNNYKTQRCKFFDETGKCKFDKNCTYAHGDPELRNPYDNPTIPSFMPPPMAPMLPDHTASMMNG